LKQLCEEKNIVFVEIDVDEKTWKEKYLYMDGLHPNNAGHKLIGQKVISELEKIILK
jgi:lysophospholipase L1-like esterase